MISTKPMGYSCGEKKKLFLPGMFRYMNTYTALGVRQNVLTASFSVGTPVLAKYP